METGKQLAKRIEEVYLNGKWIANTNYKDILPQTTWTQATTKIGSLNTIASLTYHINYYLAGILHALDTGNLGIKDKYSFDCPPINSKKDWENLQKSIYDNSEKMVAQIAQLSNEKLEGEFVNPKYGTLRKNIEGMIEHSYYHLGQISLIKKLIIEPGT